MGGNRKGGSEKKKRGGEGPALGRSCQTGGPTRVPRGFREVVDGSPKRIGGVRPTRDPGRLKNGGGDGSKVGGDPPGRTKGHSEAQRKTRGDQRLEKVSTSFSN